jgi:hypothetical protein
VPHGLEAANAASKADIVSVSESIGHDLTGTGVTVHRSGPWADPHRGFSRWRACSTMPSASSTDDLPDPGAPVKINAALISGILAGSRPPRQTSDGDRIEC